MGCRVGMFLVTSSENLRVSAGKNLNALYRADILDLHLHIAALVGVFFDGIADIKGTFRFNVARLRTLSEGDAVHYLTRFIIDEFQFDMFLSASHNLARSVIIYAMCPEKWLLVAGTEGLKTF